MYQVNHESAQYNCYVMITSDYVAYYKLKVNTKLHYKVVTILQGVSTIKLLVFLIYIPSTTTIQDAYMRITVMVVSYKLGSR